MDIIPTPLPNVDLTICPGDLYSMDGGATWAPVKTPG